MPLIIADEHSAIIDADRDFSSFEFLFDTFPRLKESTLTLFDGENMPTIEYDCERDAILYVMQGECAIVSPNDETIELILTDDTTTCITGIIRHRPSGVTSLTHYDRPLEGDIFRASVQEQLSKMCQIGSNIIEKTECKPNDRNPFESIDFDLFLIGGYCDESDTSRALTAHVLQQLHSIIEYKINLLCAYVGPLNTKSIRIYNDRALSNVRNVSSPIVYGTAIEIKSGRLLRANLSRANSMRTTISGVPLYDIRRAAVTFGSMKKYKEIYDPERGLLVIGPIEFERNSLGANACAYFQWALNLGDKDLLQRFSTSPYVEPSHFVNDLRNVFQFFIDNRHINIERLYFPLGRARLYRHYRLNLQQKTLQETKNNATKPMVQYRWKEIV